MIPLMARLPDHPTIADIDWQQLWRNARARKSWRSKTADGWSSKAAGLAQRVRGSSYATQLLELLNPAPESTVLDIGCGPGTLALPLAERVASVTAIDFAAGMIAVLKTEARRRRLDNLRTITAAWEDDWETLQIGPHDLAIASRSLNLDDLQAALLRLDAYARQRAVIVDRIDPTPFDPDAFAALGRPFRSGPDYIYTFNLLYRLGIHPEVHHLEMEAATSYQTIEEAVDGYRWMFGELSTDEEKKLLVFLQSRIISTEGESVVIGRSRPQRWAVLSWETSSGRNKED